MGMDIYLYKVAKVPKHLWEGTEEDMDIRMGGNHMYKLFKDYLFEKIIVTTEEQMAESLKITVDQLREQTEWMKSRADEEDRNMFIYNPVYPLKDIHQCLKYDEISYMDGNDVRSDWYSNLSGTNWSSKRSLDELSKIIFEDTKSPKISGVREDGSEWHYCPKEHFKEQILDKFIEGETFVQFH